MVTVDVQIDANNSEPVDLKTWKSMKSRLIPIDENATHLKSHLHLRIPYIVQWMVSQVHNNSPYLEVKKLWSRKKMVGSGSSKSRNNMCI